MKTLALLVIHVLTTLAQRAGPDGAKAIIAESVLLKHQQLIAHRSARKTPKLTTSDRFLCGFLTLFMRPGRIRKAAVVLKPTTLTKFRRALLSRNYRLLFSSRKNAKPGPKGPADDLVRVIVEMKQRNSHFGCPRIAQQINKAFGVNIDKDVVRRVLAKHYRPEPYDGGPSWATFLRYTRDSLSSIPLFRRESVPPRIHSMVLSTSRQIGQTAGMKDAKQLYHGYRFHPTIISHAVWLYHRFCLSLRDVEDLLAERGIAVSYESIRHWCNRFGPEYARTLRKRQGRLGDTWYLDEVFIKIRGELHYLWRAVDQDGDTIDILVQKRRNKAAAKRFFRKPLKGQHEVPWRMITDKLKSYSAAHREVMPSVAHSTEQYANNRAEVSHEPTRQRERQMRRFKSAGQAQRFLTVYGVVGNLFRLGRHLTRAIHYREFRSRAFCEWQEVTCARIMA